jgi:hypothetical protein
VDTSVSAPCDGASTGKGGVMVEDTAKPATGDAEKAGQASLLGDLSRPSSSAGAWRP